MNQSPRLRRIVMILAALMLIPGPVSAQELSFTLMEQFVIGDDEEAPVEYLFESPKFVRTDSKGHIYVHDERQLSIRVFDKSGRFVTTIGKQGKGPGELCEIISMHVDDRDRLITADRVCERFTIFTDLGQQYETKAFPDDLYGAPQPILSFDDAFVIWYVKLTDDQPDRRLILHLHDTDLNWFESFAHAGDLFDLDIYPESRWARVQGHLKVASNGSDTIIAVPWVYGGYVYRYTRSKDAWVMDKLNGAPAPSKPYILVNEGDFEANLNYRRAALVGSQTETHGIYRAKILNWSRGFVFLPNGDLVHVTRQTPFGEIGSTSAEMFNREGTLIGYGPLQFDDPDLDDHRRVPISISILWQDEAGLVYVRRENTNGFNVLSVAELVISPR